MSFLYNFSIAAYTLLIRVAALFNAKARLWVEGRRGWKKDLANAFGSNDKIAWFHAASLGEFEQGRPVIEALRKSHPEYKILLSFFSPSGYTQKKDYTFADKVIYLPADCPGNAKYFIKMVNPNIAVFIKYEFWFNYMTELSKKKIPTVFLSVLFRKDQIFFRRYGGWFRKKIKSADHFFVQDEASAQMIKAIGIDQYTISGDTRFDRVADILKTPAENKEIERFCDGHKVLLAGSTWLPDEKVLSGLLARFPDLKFIIAPHEVKEERIKELINILNIPVARYTKDKPVTWNEKQILIIDTIGVLSSIYRYADIAYIGGAFGAGLHNIQEPAVHGMPVIFGPKYQRFREAIDLVHSGGAFAISTENELISVVGDLLSDDAQYQSACNISRQYMLDNIGATEKIMAGIEGFLKSEI